MAWFYNFNFDENTLYVMPIAYMFPVYKHRMNIMIRKEDNTIPRTTNPYVDGHIMYKVHEFPETVYKRCFWMDERDDKKAEEIRRRYLEARAKKKAEKCHYCDDSCNDIFFSWLPAMFGIETENHDYNPDVTVYISSESKMKMTVMMGDHYLVKKETDIQFCPFCGRRLRND